MIFKITEIPKSDEPVLEANLYVNRYTNELTLEINERMVMWINPKSGSIFFNAAAVKSDCEELNIKYLTGDAWLTHHE